MTSTTVDRLETAMLMRAEHIANKDRKLFETKVKQLALIYKSRFARTRCVAQRHKLIQNLRAEYDLIIEQKNRELELVA